ERPLTVIVTQETIYNILNTTSSSNSTPDSNQNLNQNVHARNATKKKQPNQSDKNE
ncbi:insertase, partial [Lactobacillus johnsonii]